MHDPGFNTKIEPNTWIIDSRYSNHMTGDQDRFNNLKRYDDGSVKFVREDGVTI